MIQVRKFATYREEILSEGGREADGQPLVKVAVAAVISNPSGPSLPGRHLRQRGAERRGRLGVDRPGSRPARRPRGREREGAAGPLLEQHVVEGTRWVEFVTEVRPEDLIVQKKRLSAFTATDLDFLLRNMGKRVVVIDGIFIDACDLATAFHASDLDYRVIALADIVRGSSEEMERAALNVLSSYVGLVLDSGELLAEWQARAGAGVER